jgi:pimeloyl-ACP methyl ester carboxylesterase
MKWLDRNEYPFTSRYFHTNGHKLHYIDEGSGETLLFVHGTPSWSFDFRNVIRKLKDSYRCVAIDHIGFGLSDKPENFDYSPEHHSRVLAGFVQNLGLSKITIVAHDFGGPIGLNFAIENPQLISRIIVLNSWLWSSESDPAFVKMKGVLKSPLLPVLYKYLNFSARFILPSVFGDRKISKKIHRHYTAPFARPSQRNGTIAFAKSLLNDQHWFEELWLKREAIAAKPVQLIWGMKDKFVNADYMAKFKRGFESTSVKAFADCGHFPQEERPDDVAACIDDFIRNASKAMNESCDLVKDDRSVAVNKNPVAQHKFE